MIHFSDFRGGTVPSNYGIPLDTGTGEIVGQSMSVALEWPFLPELYVALKTVGGIVIYRKTLYVDTQSYNSYAQTDTTASIALLTAVELTNFVITDDLIILGCQSCDSGAGWFQLYDR